ncbi:MAG TPA: transglutaminase family protein [Kofleriaceae bacterium]|nr:transglutaminase family protein [Kofleriaceae bacterium]
MTPPSDPGGAAAAGDDKLARAHALAVALADRLPGAAVSRVIGRQFPDEAEPRFAFGVRWRDEAGPGGARCAIDAAPEPPPTELGGDRYLTVTPDPGVVEVNMAPCASARAFAHQARAIWGAAHRAGLSARRRHAHRAAGARVLAAGRRRRLAGARRRADRRRLDPALASAAHGDRSRYACRMSRTIRLSGDCPGPAGSSE